LKLTVIFYRYLGGWGNFGKPLEPQAAIPRIPTSRQTFSMRPLVRDRDMDTEHELDWKDENTGDGQAALIDMWLMRKFYRLANAEGNSDIRSQQQPTTSPRRCSSRSYLQHLETIQPPSPLLRASPCHRLRYHVMGH